MVPTNTSKRAPVTWRHDVLAAVALLGLSGLLLAVLSSCQGCLSSWGCSNHTSKTTIPPQLLRVEGTGSDRAVAAGDLVVRRITIAARRGSSSPTEVSVHWAPPPGAQGVEFRNYRPDSLSGPGYHFTGVPVGTAAQPTRLDVAYRPPALLSAALTDTFQVTDLSGARILHVATFTIPTLGAAARRPTVSLPRPRVDGAGFAPAGLSSPQRTVWASNLWLYPHESRVVDEALCQQVLAAADASAYFVAVHYPRIGGAAGDGSPLPVVLEEGYEPRVALLDYTRPSNEREVMTFTLELAPERMPWVNDHLPVAEGYDWVALRPDATSLGTCPAGLAIPSGSWEFYAETLLDYSSEPNQCSGCVLEHYVCYEGQELPGLRMDLTAGARGPMKSVQANGVTCVGPGAVRLHDNASPPNPAFSMSAGEVAVVPDPPGRVVFHHVLVNYSSPNSYSVALQAESSLGLEWRFYGDEAATTPLGLPLSLPGSSARDVWVAADVAAGLSGLETVRITATASSVPGNPVWGTDLVQIGDWVPPPPPQGGSATLWVPVASRAAGVGGSQWRTDLGLLNPGAADASAALRLYAAGAVHEHTVTVAAGQQRIFGDVVGLFGLDGSGALAIETDQTLIATSRTYSLLAADDPCSPGGTFGQFLAGVGGARGLSTGQSGRLPQLAESASYRTNLAVTNTGAQTATVTIILYDAGGLEITRFDLELAPGQWRQENRVFFRRGGRADLDAASAEVRVTAGAGVLAYASVVDNVTTDPTTIPLITGGGATSIWVPVASRAGGVGGSQWRTDLGVLNPGTERASVTVRYHSGSSTSELQVMVAGGLQRIMEDVVGRFATSGSGSLEVVATRPVVVTSRTYNQLAEADPCYPGGTFGQFLAGQTSAEGMAAGQRGLLPQLQENAAFRTNLALTNTGVQTAHATVVLFDGAGDEIARFDVELAPGEWQQENRVFFRRGGRSDLAEASARVEVTAGVGVLAYASVVDNVTSDPTTIPLQR